MVETRPVHVDDLPFVAAVVNATQEPHFHVTSADLRSRVDDGRFLVAHEGPVIAGCIRWSFQDFDRPDRAWISLAVHPDHRGDDTARMLIDAAIDAIGTSATSLWLPVREDYVPSWPDPAQLGFAEVHRTFGGGLFLSHFVRSSRHASGPARLVDLTSFRSEHGEAPLHELYASSRSDKATAHPTIAAAADLLDLDDAIGAASRVALRDGACIGMALVEPSHLGAWLAVLAVRRDHREQGIGAALLSDTAEALRETGASFLNTAGVTTDQPYLRTLRSVGASIEPDWIAYERAL